MKYIIFIYIIPFIAYSQSNIEINRVEITDLSSEKINNLNLDNRNFNWISTNDGLNRYDGKINTVFKSNPFDEKTISNNNINFTHQINNEGIFIFTSSGLDFYDYSTLDFQRLITNTTPTNFYKKSKFLFIPSLNNGISVFDTENKKIIKNYLFDPRNPLSISSSNFEFDQKDIILLTNNFNDSSLWVGTNNGLNKIDLKTQSNKRFYYQKNKISIPSNEITDLYELDTTIIVGTKLGLIQINKNNNSLFEIDLLNGQHIIDIYNINNIIIIHTNEGIFEVNNSFSKLKSRIIKNQNLKVKKINNNEFVYWNGSNVERFFHYNSRLNRQSLNTPLGTEINDISNFKGAYYFSTNNGLLKISEKINNIFSVYDEEDEILAVDENDFYRVLINSNSIDFYEDGFFSFSYKLDDLSINTIKNKPILILDEDEFLYIGTDKLTVIDLYTKEVKVLENSDEGFNSIQKGEINNLKLIERNTQKELWISLTSGISIYNIDSEKFQNFRYNPRSKNKFPKGFSSIINSKNNELWLTNNQTGLYKYNSENLDLIKHYIFNIDDKSSITSASLTSIVEYNNDIYIGSDGDGLYIFQNDSLGFKNLSMNDGLLSNKIYKFLKTYQYLFILTEKGVNYFDFEFISSLTDGNNNNLRNINTEDGLNPEKILINGISFYDDQLYVYSSNNIQKIDLYNLFYDQEKPILSLTLSELIDSNFDRKKFQLDDNEIIITNEISNLELSFSSPSYYKPQNTQIFYKIEKLNDNWINLGNENKIVLQSSGYSNGFVNDNKILAPFGSYNLKVKSANSSGVESSNQIEFKLSVNPPWYLTSIAFISYVLLLVGSVFLYVRFSQGRTKRLMEEKRKEEELEEAHNLQMGLLAKENPKRDDLDISTFIKCATEVGGDYYDFIEFEDGSLLAICGDATGHGTASGMMVSITKAGLLGIDSNDPNFILKTLNKIIKKVDIGRLRMSLNLVHFQNGSMKLSSAAMPPMYHFEKKKNKVEEITISNLPLGGLMSENFTVLNKKFSKDDVLVMLSDGLPEAPNRDGDLLDYAAVKECIEKHSTKTASEIKDELVKLSDRWMNGVHNPDDITIVVCKKLKN